MINALKHDWKFTITEFIIQRAISILVSGTAVLLFISKMFDLNGCCFEEPLLVSANHLFELDFRCIIQTPFCHFKETQAQSVLWTSNFSATLKILKQIGSQKLNIVWAFPRARYIRWYLPFGCYWSNDSVYWRSFHKKTHRTQWASLKKYLNLAGTIRLSREYLNFKNHAPWSKVLNQRHRYAWRYWLYLPS